MSEQTEPVENHPLYPQLVATLEHYGMDVVLGVLAHAVLQVAQNLEGVGADPDVVSTHRGVAHVLSQASQV